MGRAADVKRPPFLTRKSDKQFDLVVIGMGSAGAVAAEFAAEQLGLRVAAIEKGRIGGDCLWTGCVPSKALLASAKAAHTVRHADHYGIGAQVPDINLTTVWDRLKAIQREIASTDDNPDRFRALGIELIEGEARVTGPREVTVGNRVLKTRFTLVCTGSRPSVPPIDGLDDVAYLTSENLFEIPRPPDSLIIIGGGPISCEIAQALTRLGVEVTMLESLDRLLQRDDTDHADRLLRILRSEGVDVQLSSLVTKVAKGGDGVTVTFSSTADPSSGPVVHKVTAQGVLVATGRTPNTASIGLEEVGIEVERQGVTVDHRNRTAVPTIYAVGDITGRANFTHTAAYDAVLAVRDMFFPGRATAPALIPWCTFTDPEVAHVGLTETEALARFGKRKVQVHRHDLEHNDRARADSTTDGEIAIVTTGGRIVGGHAIAPHAGELIHELVLAIRAGMKMSDLTDMVHIYPTLSSSIGRLAADSAYRTASKLKVLAKVGRLLG